MHSVDRNNSNEPYFAALGAISILKPSDWSKIRAVDHWSNIVGFLLNEPTTRFIYKLETPDGRKYAKLSLRASNVHLGPKWPKISEIGLKKFI